MSSTGGANHAQKVILAEMLQKISRIFSCFIQVGNRNTGGGVYGNYVGNRNEGDINNGNLVASDNIGDGIYGNHVGNDNRGAQ